MRKNQATGTRDVLRRWFEKLQDQQAWQVRNSLGTWLDFDFGPPRLSGAREARRVSTAKAWVFKTTVARIRVQGRFSLWLEDCDWTLRIGSKRIAHSESDRALIAKACRLLNGCRITKVTFGPSKRRLVLDFDDDISLHLGPMRGMAADSKLLWLSDRGRVNRKLIVRRDFHVCEHRRGDLEHDHRWDRIPSLAIDLPCSPLKPPRVRRRPRSLGEGGAPP